MATHIKRYTKKTYNPVTQRHKKTTLHAGSILLTVVGTGMMLYFSSPVLFWKMVKEPAFASFIAPIPDYSRATVLSASNESGEIVPNEESNTPNEFWFLGYSFSKSVIPSIETYTISIPKINVVNAKVSTVDTDLAKNLVQYWGTPVPPLKGNTVIFGHSTLPQLFKPGDYKTIFANAHDLSVNDLITVSISETQRYTYKISNIFITTPQDLSVLNQNTQKPLITIVTCTPPGTTWKRLIIQAELL